MRMFRYAAIISISSFLLTLFIISPSLVSANRKVPISNFKIVSFQGEWRHDTLWAIGEIKNIGTIAAGVQLEVIARDDKGRLIDTQHFWPNSVNNIFPGSSCGIKYPITEDTRAKKIEIKIISAWVWD